ncbi:MAG TPA: hypothetical protein VJ179_03805 [Patescibacteria group bacterium]|nr:hypothetical protein [Patescibacteria group bacterium]
MSEQKTSPQVIAGVADRMIKRDNLPPQNTSEMLAWIDNNMEAFAGFLQVFDGIIARFNDRPAEDVQKSFINTMLLKDVLGEKKLPSIKAMESAGGTSEVKIFMRTLRDVISMMKKGEFPEEQRQEPFLRYHTTQTDTRNLIVAAIFHTYEVLAAKREGLEGRFEPDRLVEALMEIASEKKEDGLFNALASKEGMNWVDEYPRFSQEFRRQNGFR